MTKKLIAVILVLLLLLLVMSVAIMMDKKENADSGVTTGIQETEPGTQPTIPEETGETVVDATMSGVEDSIFDDDEHPTEAPSDQKDEETKDERDNQQSSSSANKKPETGTTKPAAPTEAKPTEPAEQPGDSDVEPGNMSYEQYQAMSAGEQHAYMDSFGSIDAFFDWYNAAKEKYESEHPPIEVGDSPIDLGEVVGGNG